MDAEGHELPEPLRQLACVKWPSETAFKNEESDQPRVWGLELGGVVWLDKSEIDVGHDGPLGILGNADGDFPSAEEQEEIVASWLAAKAAAAQLARSPHVRRDVSRDISRHPAPRVRSSEAEPPGATRHRQHVVIQFDAARPCTHSAVTFGRSIRWAHSASTQRPSPAS